MFKVEVFTGGVLTNTHTLETSEQAEKWVLDNKFQIAEQKIYRAEALERKLDITGKTPQFETAYGVERVFYMFPAPQTYIITNIDEEIQKKNEEAESAEALALVSSLKTQIRALNKRKIKTGVWTPEIITAFFTSPLISQAERALNQASLGSYLGLIPQATAFYSTEEIAVIATQVQEHVQKWAAKGVI